MSDLAQYIAAILLNSSYMTTEETLGGSASSLRDLLAKSVGASLAVEDVSAALLILEPFAAAEQDHSPLTGGFWNINFDNFRYYFIESKPEGGDDEGTYLDLKARTSRYPILEAYARRGRQYALDAASHLRKLQFAQWDELRDTVTQPEMLVPASDRVVSLSDNASRSISCAVEDLLATLEPENSIDGDVELRSRFVGQIKAAKELVLAQSVRAYLLYEVAFSVLARLIDRYGGKAIGEAAKKLLDLLVEEVFKR